MSEDFHHYKGSNLSRSENVQRIVSQMLLDSDLSDEKRESSKIWEMKHSSSCTQIGRILAQIRNLDVEIAEIICVLHDVSVIKEGTYKDHGKKSAAMAKKILEDTNDFTNDEIDLITEAIAYHSEKDTFTDKPYVELAKDADVMDCSLYEGVVKYYEIHKSKEEFECYVKRIKNVRKGLGMQTKDIFR